MGKETRKALLEAKIQSLPQTKSKLTISKKARSHQDESTDPSTIER
jgi:hypothetical protein